MTKRIEVTDEMIKRFREAAGPYLGLPKPPSGALLSDDAIRAWKNEVARGILEKTLAPSAPAEPEIPVSEGMINAGDEVAACSFRMIRGSIVGIYRAMEAQRRKEESEQRLKAPKSDRFHRRATADISHTWKEVTPHRRKDDP